MALETSGATRQQKIILAVLAVIGLIYFYNKVYAPMGDKIDDARQTLQKKQTELTNMRKKARQLDALEKELKVLEGQLEATEKKLPKTKELPEFIRTITATVEKYNMDVESLRPGSPSSGEYYMTYPYSLALQNDYHGFARFFTEIAGLDRIFNIKNLNIVAADTADGDKEVLTASFSIIAYTFKQ